MSEQRLRQPPVSVATWMHAYYNMRMLSKRTSILFEPEEYDQLQQLAEEQRTSVGALVRSAVRQAYLKQPQKKNSELLKEMKEIAGDAFKGLTPADIKDMIEEGRRY